MLNVRWNRVWSVLNILLLIVLGAAGAFIGFYWNNWFNRERLYLVVVAIICVILGWVGFKTSKASLRIRCTLWLLGLTVLLFFISRLFVFSSVNDYQAFAVGEDGRAVPTKAWRLYPLNQRFILVPNRSGQYEVGCYVHGYGRVCKLRIELDMAARVGSNAKEITNFFSTSNADFRDDDIVAGRITRAHIERMMKESFRTVEPKIGFEYALVYTGYDYPINSTSYGIFMEDRDLGTKIRKFQATFAKEFEKRLPRVCKLTGPIKFVEM